MPAKEIAERFDIDLSTYYSWERGDIIPKIQRMEEILAFLGYDPGSTMTHLYGEQIAAYREFVGISREKLAQQMGVNPMTLCYWENKRKRPSRRMIQKLSNFFSIVSADHKV